MLIPTTLRLEKDLDRKIHQFVALRGLDKASFYRSLLLKGFQQTFQEYIFEEYAQGRLSWGEACARLEMDRFQFFELLQSKGKNLSVSLPDALGAASWK